MPGVDFVVTVMIIGMIKRVREAMEYSLKHYSVTFYMCEPMERRHLVTFAHLEGISDEKIHLFDIGFYNIHTHGFSSIPIIH